MGNSSLLHTLAKNLGITYYILLYMYLFRECNLLQIVFVTLLWFVLSNCCHLNQSVPMLT